MLVLSMGGVQGQQYGGDGGSDPYYEPEYEQDNLYYDYAARQEQKG